MDASCVFFVHIQAYSLHKNQVRFLRRKVYMKMGRELILAILSFSPLIYGTREGTCEFYF